MVWKARVWSIRSLLCCFVHSVPGAFSSSPSHVRRVPTWSGQLTLPVAVDVVRGSRSRTVTSGTPSAISLSQGCPSGWVGDVILEVSWVRLASPCSTKLCTLSLCDSSPMNSTCLLERLSQPSPLPLGSSHRFGRFFPCSKN